jgi:two-component system OmpR family sensor kinase
MLSVLWDHPLDGRSRSLLATNVVAITAATAIIAIMAAVAIRQLSRQDDRDSEQARTVIAVAKLRAGTERLAARARESLLNGDGDGRIDSRTRDLEARLRAVSGSLGPGRHQMATDVGAALQQYAEALKAALALRGQGGAAVARALREEVQPRRDALEAALARLAGAEESELAALEEAGDAISSTMADVAIGVALVAMVAAVVLGVLLARAFESLTRKGEQLEGAKRGLEAANADLEAFAGRVAHDLRTPLTPISLLAGSLRRRSTDVQVVHAAERICASARRASEMVDGLLAFSRGGRDADAVTAAAPIVEESLEQIGEQLGAADVQLQREVDRDATVACPGSLYRQIVDNLVSNALKHLSGRQRRWMRVRLCSLGDKVRLQIEDSGPGIPAESLQRIFEPYYRVPGTSTPGTGIGLATVHRIVEAHGGEISVSSRLEAGSVFTVDLPVGR